MTTITKNVYVKSGKSMLIDNNLLSNRNLKQKAISIKSYDL